MVGGRQSNLRSDNPHPTAAPPVLRPSVKFSAVFARILTAANIRKYFDSTPHSHLREILDQRVTDGVIRRMIDKWLNAGVLEAGNLHFATEGTPQGGVISPLLSNIFLHHVLDKWFEDVVRPFRLV